tara:strand:- start:524 stop:1819 length:1296 start_codon:yes stop_codon:yes gene_type:complete
MKLNAFKLIVLFIFGGLAVLGVIFFAGFTGGGSEKDSIGEVEIWGVLDERVMSGIIKEFKNSREDFDGVEYVEKDPRTFSRDFVEALAVGKGPDIILLGQDDIVQTEDKIFVIPYDSYPERAFKNTFIEEGELYLAPDGVIGIPFLIDPLVMYWNRDIFSSNGVARPPEFWDEFFTLAPLITKKDEALNITKSAIAFGEFQNVTNAKEILSALIIQAGNPITNRSTAGIQSIFGERLGFAISPAESALRFYTEFSNPVKDVYSWNKSMPDSREAFLAGDLAVYFGFASEVGGLRDGNPNLNFDVALLPQSRDTDIKTTFGNMTAFAISHQSDNVPGAFRAASALSGDGGASILSQITGLPPATRSLLSERPTDARLSVFYDSALISKAWLDPDEVETEVLFGEMVDGVVSGRTRLGEAVNIVNDNLNELLK